jgi:steroid 5-alpha reductase family enzyme
MLTLLLQASLLIGILVTLLWLWSILITNVSIVDVFWGLGFVIINTFYALQSEPLATRQLLLLLLVSVWGLRLSVYLAWRNYGRGEDFRYQEFRRTYGVTRYWWISYFQVFLLQGALLLLISLPLLATHTNTQNNTLHWLDYLAIVVWLIGFIFEAGGDYQLWRFKQNSALKGQVLQTGFWKYTRHPNYFGDAMVWCAYALFCLASGSYWPIVGTVIMVVLLLKVSGVALLEKTLKATKPEYKSYIERTNAFLPWFPKQPK